MIQMMVAARAGVVAQFVSAQLPSLCTYICAQIVRPTSFLYGRRLMNEEVGEETDRGCSSYSVCVLCAPTCVRECNWFLYRAVSLRPTPASLSAYNVNHDTHEGNWASQAGIHSLPNPMTGQGTLYVGVLFYSGMSPREIVEYL